MQAAQHTLDGAGVVVLNKRGVKVGGFVKCLLVEAFIEEAARIAEHLGLDDQHIGNGGWGDFQFTSRQGWVGSTGNSELACGQSHAIKGVVFALFTQEALQVLAIAIFG